jgi:pimeloyl-[acyl-carrier protein] methyl ester esterase
MTPKVLNGPGWQLGISSGIDAARSARAVAAMRADWPRYVPHILENMFAPGSGGTWREYACAEIAKNDGAVMAAVWESLATQDFRAFLPAIGVPTLIAHGAQSRIYREDVARYQAAAIPGARLVRFAASGHSPHLEEPERFTEMVRSFCRHP